MLNLEDLDDLETAAVYKGRVEKAHRHGFKALGHFGVPKAIDLNKQICRCIQDPVTIEYYTSRLRSFFRECDADEVMIYTYDQSAWLCSEYGDCPLCKGVPIYDRLVPFLEALVDAAQQGRPGATLWWEPWELSEGQIIEVVERIRPDHFGIIMHSNIGEVNFINTVDLPCRNIARLAKSRRIPFVSEGFFGGSGEDIETLTHMPCPRLVYQQMDSMRRACGVTGIKEYYGLDPADFSVNTDVFAAYLQSPDKELQELLLPITAAYGSCSELLLEAWELSSQGMELFPYNASWWLRFLLSRPETQSWTKLQATDWDTPAWKSSRRAYYMVTNEAEQHPWLLEDIGLRTRAASRRFAQAVRLLAEAETNSLKARDIEQQRQCLTQLMTATKCFGETILSSR